VWREEKKYLADADEYLAFLDRDVGSTLVVTRQHHQRQRQQPPPPQAQQQYPDALRFEIEA
jgi:hypothetical protein